MSTQACMHTCTYEAAIKIHPCAAVARKVTAMFKPMTQTAGVKLLKQASHKYVHINIQPCMHLEIQYTYRKNCTDRSIQEKTKRDKNLSIYKANISMSCIYFDWG